MMAKRLGGMHQVYTYEDGKKDYKFPRFRTVTYLEWTQPNISQNYYVQTQPQVRPNPK